MGGVRIALSLKYDPSNTATSKTYYEFTKLYVKKGRRNWQYDINVKYNDSYKENKYSELIETVKDIETEINKQLQRHLQRIIDHNKKVLSNLKNIEEGFSFTIAVIVMEIS